MLRRPGGPLGAWAGFSLRPATGEGKGLFAVRGDQRKLHPVDASLYFDKPRSGGEMYLGTNGL